MMRFTTFIVTGFGVGKAPYAQGTLGSLLAFPLCYLLLAACIYFQVRLDIFEAPRKEQEIYAILLVFILSFLIILFAGKYLSDIYIKHTGKEDPKEIVIDEIMGQMLTMMLTFFCPVFVQKSYLSDIFSSNTINFTFMFLLPFVLFRIFDIIKPWPINWVDQNVKGGLGVMLDDFLAAIFASTSCYMITFIIIGDLSAQ